MTFHKCFRNRIISTSLALSIALSTVYASGIPALAATATKTTTEAPTPRTDPNTGNEIKPGVEETLDSYSPTARRSMRTMASAATSTTIDPSDLSEWTVFTRYYHPDWPFLSDSESTMPGDWNSTVNAKGQHPFLYWKDPMTSYSVSYGTKDYYDLDDPAEIAQMEADCMSGAYESYVSNFSKHIYTTGSADKATITFLGYGTYGLLDFALAPVTASGLKSVGFDIDAEAIDTHTLMSYGVLFNAGIGSDGMLKGYFLDFNIFDGVRIFDLSQGIDANRLHLNTAVYYTDPSDPTGYYSPLSTPQTYYDYEYDENGSPIRDEDGNYVMKEYNIGSPIITMPEFSSFQTQGRLRIDLDITENDVKVSVSSYDSVGNLGDPIVETVSLPTDTGYANYGPYVQYYDHACWSLSYIKFSNMQMSVNYDVIFDANGGQFGDGTDTARVNGIEPGKSIRDMGMALPSQPTREGYSFLGWYTSVDGSNDNFDENTAISRITTAVAQWTQDSVVTFVSGGNGSLTGKTSESIAQGSSVSIIPTVKPDAGYSFSHWVDETGKQYQNNELASITPVDNMTITAVFVRDAVSIEYVAGANGTLSGTTSYPSVSIGDPLPAAPTPVPDGGYVFINWTDADGNVVIPGTTLITDGATIKANFELDADTNGVADSEQDEFLVHFTAGTNGAIAGQDTFIVLDDGGNTKLSSALGGFAAPDAIPNPGYTFSHWEDANGNQYDTADLASLPVNGNLSVTAVFEIMRHDITFEAGSNGKLTGNTTINVEDGAPITDFPTPEADSGYAFDHWEDATGKTIDPANVIAGEDTKTIIAVFSVDEDGEGTPDYVQERFTVNLKAGSNGTIAGTQSFTVLEKPSGSKLVDALGGFTAPTTTPNNGFAFSHWADDAGNQYSTVDLGNVAITGSMTLTAVFDNIQHEITFEAGPNGKLTGTTTVTVNEDAPIANFPTPVADSGYVFDRWEDAKGNVIDPSTVVASEDTKKLIAVFERDENGDGVADSKQNRIEVKFAVKDPAKGKLVGGKVSLVVLANKDATSTPLRTAIGGLASIATPIATTTAESTMKFWWWEDEKGQQIDLNTYEVTTGCTLYAFFDSDRDNNKTPDSLQDQFTVKFETKGSNGKLTGTQQVTVYGDDGLQTLADAIGGFTAPTPAATNATTTFYRWEDASGNEIPVLKDYQVIANTTVYARFEADLNKDGIADIVQNKHTVTFQADTNGKLTGTTSYTLIGGAIGDGKPLTNANVVGTYTVPTPAGVNAEFNFTAWTASSTSMSTLNNDPTTLSLTGDVTFTANFTAKEYTIRFTSNGTEVATLSLPKGATVGTNPDVSAATAAGQTFAYWLADTGATYTSAQILDAVVSGNTTFTAKFTTAKAAGKR